MMYKVIKYFTDLHDKEYPYNVGDSFPHDGVEVTEKRLEELSGSDNKQGTPLIELMEEPETPEENVEQDVVEEPVVEKAAAKPRAKKDPVT